MAALRNGVLAAVGPGDFDRPGNFFTRLIAWRQAHIPDDDVTTLVHGDYRIGNLMFPSTQLRVDVLFARELSTLGHPPADVTHNGRGRVSRPEDCGGIAGIDHAALGIPDREG